MTVFFLSSFTNSCVMYFFYDMSSPGNVALSCSLLLSVFIWKQAAVVSPCLSSLVSEDGTINLEMP